MDEHLEKIEEMQELLCCKLHHCMTYDFDGLDLEEAYKTVDMIKDLAQTEKYMHESNYYHHVVTAMESGDGSLDKTITTIRNMWSSADHDMKVSMKQSLMKLVSEMTV